MAFLLLLHACFCCGTVQGRVFRQERSSLKLLGNASLSRDEPEPVTDCHCDLCVSANRKTVTEVSDTKCIPAPALHIGQSCIPDSSFPEQRNGDEVPYQLFCMCACQPYLRAKSD